MVNEASTRSLREPDFLIISAPKQVVPEHESHEGEHQHKADAIHRLHHPLRYRAAQDGLDSVKDEMPAIERRNRQQIEYADTDGQQGHELNQPLEAELDGLLGHAGNLDRAAELAFVLPAHHKALQELPCVLGVMAGFLHRRDHRAGGAVGDQARLANLAVVDDADDSDLDRVAQRVLLLHQPRSGNDGHLLAVPQHDEGDGIPSPAGNQPLHVAKSLDLDAVHTDETVTGHDARLLRRAAGRHFGHRRLRYPAAIGGKEHREHGYCEQEIEQWAGKHRGRPLPYRLHVEGYAPLRLAQPFLRFRAGWAGGRVHVADEFHIAAERNRAKLPASAVAVVEAGNFRAEANREGGDAYAAQPADQIVAHLVDEDHHGEHEQERHERSEEESLCAGSKADNIVQIRTSVALTRAIAVAAKPAKRWRIASLAGAILNPGRFPGRDDPPKRQASR